MKFIEECLEVIDRSDQAKPNIVQIILKVYTAINFSLFLFIYWYLDTPSAHICIKILEFLISRLIYFSGL